MPDSRQLCRLLRAPRERPHGRGSAEERHEFTPPHSTASSAIVEGLAGTFKAEGIRVIAMAPPHANSSSNGIAPPALSQA